LQSSHVANWERHSESFKESVGERKFGFYADVSLCAHVCFLFWFGNKKAREMRLLRFFGEQE
jgi:hypothetical protein